MWRQGGSQQILVFVLIYRFCFERAGVPSHMQYSDIPSLTEPGVKWFRGAKSDGKLPCAASEQSSVFQRL